MARSQWVRVGVGGAVEQPATRTVNVVYATGYPPVSFHGTLWTTGADGAVRWRWHEMAKGDSGGAVSCTYYGAVRTGHTRSCVTR